MIIKNVLLIVLLGVISLNAQVFQVQKNWNLFGATQNIDSLKVFEGDCVVAMYAYNKDKQWDIYPDGKLTKIDKGIGFWLHAKKSCSIDTDKTTASFDARSFFTSKCAVCHGDKGQGSRFRAIKGNPQDWYLSKLKPFQSGSKTSPSAMSNALKGFDTNNLDELTRFLATL